MSKNILNSLPVGYITFHENEAFNFQLNRFYSLGAFSKDELIKISLKIDGFEAWINTFTNLGQEAEDTKMSAPHASILITSKGLQPETSPN